jgi:hypothetical protein
MFQTEIVEKIKTHILCSENVFPENLAVYERMWKNIVERDRPQVKIWRMRISCCIAKATNTYSGYVLLIAFLQQWLHERAVTLHCLSLFLSFKASRQPTCHCCCVPATCSITPPPLDGLVGKVTICYAVAGSTPYSVLHGMHRVCRSHKRHQFSVV